MNSSPKNKNTKKTVPIKRNPTKDICSHLVLISRSLPQRANPDRIYLHAESLRRLGISIGENVIVNALKDDNSAMDQKKRVIATIWKSETAFENQAQLGSLLLESLDCAVDEKIVIRLPEIVKEEAEVMVVEPFIKKNFKENEFTHLCILQSLVGRSFLIGNFFVAKISGKKYKFRINDINNELNSKEDSTEESFNKIFQVESHTKLIIELNKKEPEKVIVQDQKKLGFDSIGGLTSQLNQVIELTNSLHQSSLFSKYGLKPPKGILLYGPPGTGKTMIARVIASQCNASFFTLSAPEVMSKFYGKSEEKLRNIFAEAEKSSPSIIFIDEIDAICPKREDTQSDFEKRIVSTLLTLLDGAESKDGIFLIGATNRPHIIDSSLRRPGRFDREIEIGVPDEKGRLEILNIIVSKMKHNLTDKQLKKISKKSHGFVGADLQSLCKEASIHSLKRVHKEISVGDKDTKSLKNESSVNVGTELCVSYDDFVNALKEVSPSALREIAIEVPNVKWADIGGQQEIKQRLKEAIEWPLKYPSIFKRMNIDVPKGILMYGPPGCSKTLIAKAIATESELNFIAVKGPELYSKWVGESEKAIHNLFKKAKQCAPSIVFFDEIDAIGSKRGAESEGSSVTDRVLSQLLIELDGIESSKSVLLVAATNRPDILDSALIRPGRIDRMIYIEPPNSSTRKQIFEINLKDIPLDSDVNLDQLAELSEGYSGAEVVSICTQASLNAIRDDKNALCLSQRHFLQAIQSTKGRITKEMLEFYQNFKEKVSSNLN